MWRSVPHTPACRTAINTSPGPAAGFRTLVTSRPGARCCLTIACITREPGRGGKAALVRYGDVRRLDAHRAALQLGHLCVGIEHRVGQQIRGGLAEMERHEHLPARHA